MGCDHWIEAAYVLLRKLFALVTCKHTFLNCQRKTSQNLQLDELIVYILHFCDGTEALLFDRYPKLRFQCIDYGVSKVLICITSVQIFSSDELGTKYP